jgi:DNA-binding LytR/AlgR family response regulator
MINLVAIDDEQLPLELIKTYCEQLEHVQLLKTFSKIDEAKLFLENNKVDLLILDIEMPNQNGIEFYESLSQKPLLILSTAYAQYALKGFQVQAIDYLLKPYSFNQFSQAIDKVNTVLIGARAQINTGTLKMSIDYSTVFIPIDTIIYIESFGDFLSIHTTNKPVVKARGTLKKIITELPSLQFLRVHRSYIVCIAHIKSIRNKFINIAEMQIPIGGNFEEKVNEVLGL